ncbi:phosphate acyltransferase PlsX [Mycoplasmopsis gallinarum]
MKYKIAFDFNGNDLGTLECLYASIQFLKENPDYLIYAVGNEEEIIAGLNQIKDNEVKKRLLIVNNLAVPSDKKNVRKSLHEKTSMSDCFDLLTNKEADAVLSAGDSGILLSMATLKAKRLDNVARPAFMPIVPTINQSKFFLLDAGANLETKAEYLQDWAIIANAFAKVLLKIDNPRVALINIGTEDYKGTQVIQEAQALLKENQNINYVGFQEPRDLLAGSCDVALIDGYGGNLMLKSTEGAIKNFAKLLKRNLLASFITKIGALLSKKAFKTTAEVLDYRSVGAAWVIGVNALVAKAHGASDRKAFYNALKQIKLALENDILNKIKNELGIDV